MTLSLQPHLFPQLEPINHCMSRHTVTHELNFVYAYIWRPAHPVLYPNGLKKTTEVIIISQ